MSACGTYEFVLTSGPSGVVGIMADEGGVLGREYGHGGGGPGWNLHAAHYPELRGQRVSIAVLCNQDAEHAGPIARALASAV